MAVSIAQYVDLLVKKLQGVAKTANAAVKGASNESIASPLFLRGDIIWMQSNQIPSTAQAVANISLALTGANSVECAADNTVPPIGGVSPTWLTNTTYWIPQELGSTWLPKVYVGPPAEANIEATGTQIFAAGIGGVGDYYFDPQAGVLNFIGETIPAVLTAGNVVYISGYQYTGVLGVTNVPNNSNIGNINITDTTISSITSSLVTIGGAGGLVLPAGNIAQRPVDPPVGATRFNTTTDVLESYDGAEWVSGGNIITPGAVTDQQITPDGVSNTYVLDQDATSASVLVSINGISQVPDIAYVVIGNSITFTSTPLTSDLIDVRFITYFSSFSSLTNAAGNSSISITPSGNIQFTTGNLLFATITTANTLSAVGNISAPYFFGNVVGNISGNLVVPGATNDVLFNTDGSANASSALTFDPGSNVLTIGGNVVATNLLATGIVSGNRFVGNAFSMSNVRGANVTGAVALATFAVSAGTAATVTTGAQPNITSVGTLTSLTVSGSTTTGNLLTNGQISVTGNVTASRFTGNAATLSSVTAGNITGNTITGSQIFSTGDGVYIGNVEAAYFTGNGSLLTGLTVNYSNANVSSYLEDGLVGDIIPLGNSVYTLGNATNQWADIYISNASVYFDNVALSSEGNTLLFAGNPLVTTNIPTIGDVTIEGNLSGSNISTAGTVTASGNISGAIVTATRFVGNGSTLSSITGSNVTGVVANAVSATVAVTVSGNVQSNITTVGTLTSLAVLGNAIPGNLLTNGQVSAGGNVTAARFIGNGSTLSSITGANVTGTVANAAFATSAATAVTVTGNAQPNITTVGTLTSLAVSGDVAAGNVLTGGIVSAVGNITAPYFIGNIIGNISGNLTVPGANTQILYNNNGQANASAGLTFDFSSNSLVSTGTITGSNFLTGGQISAGGNVTAGRFVGNAALLSSITGANVTGTVANATFATSAGTVATVTTAAQPNITSVGTLTSLAVLGNAAGGNLTTVGQVSATGNITTDGFFLGTFAGNISGNLVVPGSNTQLIYNNNGIAGASAGLAFDSASNVLSVGGNVTAARFVGNAATLSSITAANIVGAVANATFATSAATSATITTNAQPNITSVGTLTSLAVSGNASGGNLTTAGQVSATGNITTAGFFLGTFAGNIAGNLTVPGANTQVIYNDNGNAGASTGLTFDSASNVLSIGGNVTASRFIGNGSTLSSIAAANIVGTVANAVFATSAGTAGTVTGNAQPNVTSVGTLNSLTVSGNASTGNLSTGGQVSAVGNITGANLLVNADAVITGNLTVNGTTTTVNSNTVTINDKFINVANNASSGTLANGGGLGVGPVGTEYATLTFNNATTAWNTNIPLSVAGNVSGSFFIGNGAALSSIAGANVLGTVANAVFATTAGSAASATTAGTVTANAQANITSVGTLTSLLVTGNVTGGNLSAGTGTVTAGNIVNSNANGVGNIGSSTTYFNTVFAKATSAQYADLAENYLADADYPPGTVVSFGGVKEITVSQQDQDSRVVGVISTNPAYQMNSGLTGEHVLPLALAGRVPCLVQGPVKRGDMMVSAGNGRARSEKSPTIGTVIGKSLEDFNGGLGTIEILISQV